MRAILVLALLAAGCAKEPTEASKWRAVNEVYVVVDVGAFYANLQKAMSTAGYGKVTINNAPPVYKLHDGGMMVYLRERGIPEKTSYTPMTAHQAAEAALKQEGATGICVDAGASAGCARLLDHDQIVALEAELKGDGEKPKSFAMTVTP
jgi:hypothetical protein